MQLAAEPTLAPFMITRTFQWYRGCRLTALVFGAVVWRGMSVVGSAVFWPGRAWFRCLGWGCGCLVPGGAWCQVAGAGLVACAASRLRSRMSLRMLWVAAQRWSSVLTWVSRWFRSRPRRLNS